MKKIFLPILTLFFTYSNYLYAKTRYKEEKKEKESNLVLQMPTERIPEWVLQHTSHASHVSHAAHASHYSQVSTIQNHEDYEALSKRQVNYLKTELAKEFNWPIKDIIIKKANFSTKCKIELYIDGEIKKKVDLNPNIKCINITYTIGTGIDYNMLIPLDETHNTIYIISNQYFNEYSKTNWMRNIVNMQ